MKKRLNISALSAIVALLIVSSCANSNVVSNGIIQKRKYNKGFFVKSITSHRITESYLSNRSDQFMSSDISEMEDKKVSHYQKTDMLHTRVSTELPLIKTKGQDLGALTLKTSERLKVLHTNKSERAWYIQNHSDVERNEKYYADVPSNTVPDNQAERELRKKYIRTFFTFLILAGVSLIPAFSFYYIGIAFALASFVFLIISIIFASLARASFKRSKGIYKSSYKGLKNHFLLVNAGKITLFGLLLICLLTILTFSSIGGGFLFILLFSVAVVAVLVFGTIALARFHRIKAYESTASE